jgi:hypothetical protein
MSIGIVCRSTRKLPTPLQVKDGGTGLTSIPSERLLAGSGSSSLVQTYAAEDSTSASSFSSSSTGIPTERRVYYGLPSLNGSHSYNSSYSYYAPASYGTSKYVLAGNGTSSIPTWSSQGNFSVGYGYLDYISPFTDDGTYIIRWGFIVTLHFVIQLKSGYSLSSGTWNSVGTIRSGARPYHNVYGMIHALGDAIYGEVRITTAGTVSIAFPSSVSTSGGEKDFIGEMSFRAA